MLDGQAMTNLLTPIQIGVVLPDDAEKAAALIEEVMETERQEQAALEFLREREKMLAEDFVMI